MKVNHFHAIWLELLPPPSTCVHIARCYLPIVPCTSKLSLYYTAISDVAVNGLVLEQKYAKIIHLRFLSFLLNLDVKKWQRTARSSTLLNGSSEFWTSLSRIFCAASIHSDTFQVIRASKPLLWLHIWIYNSCIQVFIVWGSPRSHSIGGRQ